MAQGKKRTKKHSTKAATTPRGEKRLSDFEKEMAERAAALIAAGKMPAFEDVLRAVKKVREREVGESAPQGDADE